MYFNLKRPSYAYRNNIIFSGKIPQILLFKVRKKRRICVNSAFVQYDIEVLTSTRKQKQQIKFKRVGKKEENFIIFK